MRTFLIKLLFRLLKVNSFTKNIIYLEDIKKLKPLEGNEVIKSIQLKYDKALSSVLAIPHFIEWLYYQVIEKQREHVTTFDKQKREHQVATILLILYMINEIREADMRMKLYKK